MGHPVKLADELVGDARVVAKTVRRSLNSQIELWASLGEALEPLLQGHQVIALLRANAAKPLSECLDSVDTPAGRRRVSDYLSKQPFPRYEAAGAKGRLVRIQADGTREAGRFVSGVFTPEA